jgi:hypothetical protein
MNLNWFKSSIKRYFEIDVDPVTNDKSGLRQNSNISGLWNNDSDGSSELHIRDSWSTGDLVYVGNVKKCARYGKDARRAFSSKTDTRRSPFFIARVENHYHNEIDSDVYSPLVALGNNEPGYDFPVWRRRLGISNPIDESFLTPIAVSHLTHDSPKLLAEIIEYQKHYNQYHRDIESLPRIIDSIVKSKFIECGVYPTTSNNYHNVGYYHFGDVGVLLEQVWDNYLHYVDDLKSYKAKNNVAIRSYSERDDILFLDGFVIGNGDCDQKDKMREALDGIPCIRIILNVLKDLRDRRLDLDSRVDRIQSLAIPFHTQIRRNHYRTQCPCCPTQNPAIWNFG